MGQIIFFKALNETEKKQANDNFGDQVVAWLVVGRSLPPPPLPPHHQQGGPGIESH